MGSNLRGVCYILDEPTIGLHPRDNRMLLDTLARLEGKGNTVVVVEHDKEIMLKSDYVIDLGPGAGIRGGHLVGQGTPGRFKRSKTLTAEYLSNRKMIAVPEARREGNGSALRLTGASGHNLKDVNLEIPLGTVKTHLRRGLLRVREGMKSSALAVGGEAT